VDRQEWQAMEGSESRRRQMERTRGLKSGLKAAAVTVFFAAALLSTGCSSNALMNPQPSLNAQGGQTAQSGGHVLLPGGHVQVP
jgi:hypothetical protein